MAAPTFVCEIAFATDPAADPVWTDVSGRLLAFTLTRGRQHEYDRVEAAVLNVSLADDDRTLDPLNTASAFYPNVLPMRRIRLSAILDAATYRLFTGYVERWPRARKQNAWAQVDLEAVDGFTVLANVTVSGSFPQELAGARVNRILDLAGWPADMRSVDAGQSEVQAQTVTADEAVNALQHIQEVVEPSELGLFFVAGDGDATFLDRHAVLRAPYTTVQATFSDQPAVGELPYADLTPSYDIDLVYNDVIGTREGGSPQEALDSDSIARFLKRTQTRSTWVTSDGEQMDQCEYILSRAKTPLVRYEQVKLRPGDSGELWAQVLARDLLDRVSVVEHPPGGGAAANEQEVHVQRVELRTNAPHAADVDCTWGVYPADLTAYMVLDDLTNGRLDYNALAY